MAATAATAVAAMFASVGCDLLSDDPEPAPSPDPLAPLLAGTAGLIARYDAALAVRVDLTARLTPIRDAHRAHATELAAMIGVPVPVTSAPATPSEAPTTPTGERLLPDLRSAELNGRKEAVTACLAAPADRAGLLGSIAAARASHAEALR